MSSSSRLLSTSSIGFLGSKVFLRPSHPDDDRRSRSTEIVRQHHHITPFDDHTDTHRYGMRYPETDNNVSHTQHNTQMQGTLIQQGCSSFRFHRNPPEDGWTRCSFSLGNAVSTPAHIRILKIPLHEHSGDARYGNGNSLSEDAAGEPK